MNRLPPSISVSSCFLQVLKGSTITSTTSSSHLLLGWPLDLLPPPIPCNVGDGWGKQIKGSSEKKMTGWGSRGCRTVLLAPEGSSCVEIRWLNISTTLSFPHTPSPRLWQSVRLTTMILTSGANFFYIIIKIKTAMDALTASWKLVFLLDYVECVVGIKTCRCIQWVSSRARC